MSGGNNNQHGNTMAAIFASQAQGQLQGEAQGQLQGEAQGQLQNSEQEQGQGQGQGQDQGQSQYSENESFNENGNLNGSLNANGNLNGNLNANANINHVDTAVNTAVNTNVNVSVGGEWAPPSETGVIHLDNVSIDHLDGSFFVMPDFSTQTLNGDGNIFNLDQVNSLVDNDYIGSANVSLGLGGLDSYCGPEGTLPNFNFNQTAYGNGGNASTNGNVSDHVTSGAVSSANAVSAEAFTQHITQGANIQYNSMPVSVVGGDSLSDMGSGDGGGHHNS